MSVKWYIRIGSINKEINVFKDLDIDYDGLVVSFRSIIYFYKNKNIDILRKAPTIIVDPDLTFLTCIAPKDKVTVRLAYQELGLHDRMKREDELLKVSSLSEDEIRKIAENMINFQRRLSGRSFNKKVLSFFGIQVDDNASNYILMTPYFVILSTNDPAYQVNKKLLEYSIQFKSNNELLYVVIAIDKSLLYDDQAIKQIVEDYSKYKNDVEGYAFWITDFDETEESVDSLYRLAQFVHMLKRFTGKTVINLYSGYYSLLLYKLGLIDGIVTKTCYRQWQHRCPRGGPAPDKYYITLLKTKIEIPLVIAIVSKDKNLGCNCPVCKQYFNRLIYLALRGKTQTKEVDTALKKHFLYAFSNEIKHVNETSLDKLLEELRTNYQIAEKYITELDQIDHLIAWHEALTYLLLMDLVENNE